MVVFFSPQRREVRKGSLRVPESSTSADKRGIRTDNFKLAQQYIFYNFAPLINDAWIIGS